MIIRKKDNKDERDKEKEERSEQEKVEFQLRFSVVCVSDTLLMFLPLGRISVCHLLYSIEA